MLIQQPVQPVAPATVPARVPPTAETVMAVESAAAGDRARNDGARDRGAEAERHSREASGRKLDPKQPVGPPPAFQANVLEAERARLRESEPLQGASPEAGETPEPDGTRPAPATYGAPDRPAPPQSVDLTR